LPALLNLYKLLVAHNVLPALMTAFPATYKIAIIDSTTKIY